MNKAIDLIKNTPTYIDSRSEKMFDWTLDATIELRRLTTIEQAAITLIKCKGRYHAEQNTKALAVALGLALPQVDDIDVVDLNRPSAIEPQDSEIGMPEPVTELINPA